MNKLFALSAFLTTSVVQGQYTYEWAKRWGSTQDDWAYDVAVDSQGNVITGGSFSQTVDFNPGQEGEAILAAVNANRNGYISKLAADGSFLWVCHIAGNITVRTITTDADGNIYATGGLIGSVDFDNSAEENIRTANGSIDMFIAKYTADGDLVWVTSFGGSLQEIPFGIQVNDAGQIAIGGYFMDTVDFDPGENTLALTTMANQPSAYDAFVVMFDNNGTFEWVHQIGGASNQVVTDLAFDTLGDIVVVGHFADNTNFDPEETNFMLATSSGSDSDCFIAKISATGTFEWAKQLAGLGSDNCNALALDSEDNIHITGRFGKTIDFDLGDEVFEMIGDNSYYNIFICKYDADANFIWAKQIGDDLTADYGLSIAVDGAGNVYTTGAIASSCDMNPGAEQVLANWFGVGDMFISVLDINGEYLWGKNFGSHLNDLGNALTVDDNYIYIAGVFQHLQVNFGNVSLSSAGFEDAFVLKIKYPTSVSIEEYGNQSFSVFPNPVADVLIVQNKGIPQASSAIKVFSADGRLMLQSNFSNTLDVHELKAGIYLLSIDGIVTRFVKM